MRPEDAAARALAAILPTLARPEETQPADVRLRAFFREHPSLGRRERIQAADLVFDVLRNLRLYRVLATGEEGAQEAPPERLVAQSRAPADYAISPEPLSIEPYGIMLRKDDAAFKKVVDAAMTSLYKTGQINAIYDKWFLKPVPPKGINLNVPMSAQFKKVIANPTDSGDPNSYK